MTTWMVEYTYQGTQEQRDELRPSHRDFLMALAREGHLPAFGRYVDDGPAAALLIARGESAGDVAAMLDDDPYASADLIADRRIREWPAVWAEDLSDD